MFGAQAMTVKWARGIKDCLSSASFSMQFRATLRVDCRRKQALVT
jgi:hypothetical protein